MRSTKVPEAVRELVLERDRGRCIRCGQASAQIHHRRPRGMGGSRDGWENSPANLVVLCGSGTTGCHGWVESNRAEAYDAGLLIRRGLRTPVEVPLDWFDQTVYLDIAGGVVPVV